MNLFRKTISVMLSLALCASLAAPAFAVEYDISIGDVHVESEDEKTYSWQDGEGAEYNKDNKYDHTDDKEIVIKQDKTDSETTSNTIEVGGNVKDVEITLDNVNIDASDEKKAAMSVGPDSDVTVELEGDNTLKGGTGHAGLELNNDNEKDRPVKGTEGGSVTIKDEDNDGSLTAVGGNGGAGIGGGSRDTAGSITIDGADVTATGGSGGAGIGSGSYGETDNIDITDSDVTATGGSGGAGIGSGSYGETGNIDITDSDVTAAGGSNGAGIGSGSYGDAGSIIITDSDVTATTDTRNCGAGIGCGSSGSVDSIAIEGGNIVAKSGRMARAIGGVKCGTITLKDIESLIALGHGSGTDYAIGNSGFSSGYKFDGNQPILNCNFGSAASGPLTGAKEVKVHVIDVNGEDVIEPVEFRTEDSYTWVNFAAVLENAGRYYVYVETESDAFFVSSLSTGTSIAYNVENKMLSKPGTTKCADYRVEYSFQFVTDIEGVEQPTEDMLELPESITQKLTWDDFKKGATCDKSYDDIEVEGGYWHFDGWEPTSLLTPNGNLAYSVKNPATIVGTWTFVADEPEPVDPVPPVPEEPVTPEVPEIPDDTGDADDTDDGTVIDEAAVPLASGPVTRAEFVDYLWQHEGRPAPVADRGLFEDVTEEHEYSPAVAWAKSIGIIEGYLDGTFEPDELVTVSAARGILTRYAAYLGIQMPELTALVGKDDEPVLNCGEVVAEFFGE